MLLTRELRLALLIFKLPLKLLALEQQQPIVIRPLFFIAEERIGGDYLPEPQWSVGIVGMEVGVVRFDSVAERLLESLRVVARMSTEKIVKRCHRHDLERRPVKKESPGNDCMMSAHQIGAAELISIQS